MFQHKKNRLVGFTLIELMVAVAVVAITAAIAIPGFKYEIQKSKRSDAINALSSDQSILERCYAQYLAYNNSSCSLTTGSFPQNSPKGYYIVTAPTLTATTFTLTATATGAQASDTSCSSFTIDQTNTQTATTSTCWSR